MTDFVCIEWIKITNNLTFNWNVFFENPIYLIVILMTINKTKLLKQPNKTSRLREKDIMHDVRSY